MAMTTPYQSVRSASEVVDWNRLESGLKKTKVSTGKVMFTLI